MIDPESMKPEDLFFLVWAGLISNMWGETFGPLWVKYILWPKSGFALSLIFDLEKRDRLEHVSIVDLNSWSLPYSLSSDFYTPDINIIDPEKIISASKITFDGCDLSNLAKRESAYDFVNSKKTFLHKFDNDEVVLLWKYADWEHDLILREILNVIQYTVYRTSREWLLEKEHVKNSMFELVDKIEVYKQNGLLSEEVIIKHEILLKQHNLLLADMDKKYDSFVKNFSSYMKAELENELNRSLYCKNQYSDTLNNFIDNAVDACYKYQMQDDYLDILVEFPAPPLNYDFTGIEHIIKPEPGTILIQYYKRFDYYIEVVNKIEVINGKRFFDPGLNYSERQAWVPGHIVNPYYHLDYAELCYKKSSQLFTDMLINIRSDLDFNEQQELQLFCNAKYYEHHCLKNLQIKAFRDFLKEDAFVLDPDTLILFAFNDFKEYIVYNIVEFLGLL